MEEKCYLLKIPPTITSYRINAVEYVYYFISGSYFDVYFISLRIIPLY